MATGPSGKPSFLYLLRSVQLEIELACHKLHQTHFQKLLQALHKKETANKQRDCEKVPTIIRPLESGNLNDKSDSFIPIVAVWTLSYVQLLCDPMDYSPPGSSVHGIPLARTLQRLPFPSPLAWLKRRGLTMPNVGEDVEPWELSFRVERSPHCLKVTLHRFSWNIAFRCIKVKYRLSPWPKQFH